MGQYDYEGTPESRMYDWLVTRNGSSLELCTGRTAHDDPNRSREEEDLEYVRSLVNADHGGRIHPDEDWGPEAVPDQTPEERDPEKPASATGGVDYYDMPGNEIPEPLGTAPPATRRELDEDGHWQEIEQEDPRNA